MKCNGNTKIEIKQVYFYCEYAYDYSFVFENNWKCIDTLQYNKKRRKYSYFILFTSSAKKQ